MSDFIGIAVMLNNFFHDLSVALFLCSLGVLGVVAEEVLHMNEGARVVVTRLEGRFRKTAAWSFVFIIIFGAIRAFFYRDYEWYSAVENGQVAALIVKHVIFVVLIGGALLYLRRLNRLRDKSRAPGNSKTS